MRNRYEPTPSTDPRAPGWAIWDNDTRKVAPRLSLSLPEAQALAADLNVAAVAHATARAGLFDDE